MSRTRFDFPFRVIDEEWRAFKTRRLDSWLKLHPCSGELSQGYSPDYALRGRLRDG
ncbi:MAG: hypothetical protein LBR80_17825 [Deltaproteobacteria bacterium]|nr:hypothetical protein [Deltaproteobacteria bacterium]